MKKFLTMAAVSLVLGFSASSTASAKPLFHHHMMKMKTNEVVSLIPLKMEKGFAVMVDKGLPDKSLVIIYDNDKNVVFKDVLTKGFKAEKKYILSQLPDGDYSVEIYSKNHDIQTQFFVYHAGMNKITRLS